MNRKKTKTKKIQTEIQKKIFYSLKRNFQTLTKIKYSKI